MKILYIEDNQPRARFVSTLSKEHEYPVEFFHSQGYLGHLGRSDSKSSCCNLYLS